MNPIPQERVIAAYQQAPEPVREVFSSEVTAGVVADIRTQYRLHVDIAGNIGNEVGYLLLGLRSPAEFLGGLILMGTDEQTARSIVQEINDRIFIPLQQKMLRGNGNATQDVPQTPINQESVPVATMPQPAVAPMPAPAVAFSQPPEIQQPAVPHTAPAAEPMPIHGQPAFVAAVPPPFQPQTPPAYTVPPTATPPTQPAAQQPSQSTPSFAPQQQQPFSPPSPTFVPPTPPIPPLTPQQPAASPLTQEYSADPYREPI